jgi:lipopolysaccharide/colanic/teichoic acid biosynthesis glycosyltransferase
MVLVPRREYIFLLVGDLAIFALSLHLSLTARYFTFPDYETFRAHLAAFVPLFLLWIAVFFLAGLYGKHTRIFRSRLSSVILSAQTINVTLAALFFFVLPMGLAPKTILAIYLFVSSPLIFLWRRFVFVALPRSRRIKGVLIGSGPDALALAEEIAHDHRYPFTFTHVIDTKKAPAHEVVQKACRVAIEDDIQFLVADFYDPAVSAALPIVYDAAFRKRRFALISLNDLYQEVFDRVPLSLVQYEWVLAHVGSSPVYDIAKRVVDVIGAAIGGACALIATPFIILAIKFDDGGPIFFSQERVGRYQRPFRVYKFRSMRDAAGASEGTKEGLHVTRVGRYLRVLRVDELPQLWNIFIGDLSLVGPRPETPTLAAHYNARIPYYNARFLILPGLTGWAQITHDRHPHHGADVTETKEKLSYDLYYLRHRSLILDFFIILQTARIIVSARGS